MKSELAGRWIWAHSEQQRVNQSCKPSSHRVLDLIDKKTEAIVYAVSRMLESQGFSTSPGRNQAAGTPILVYPENQPVSHNQGWYLHPKPYDTIASIKSLMWSEDNCG